MSLLLIAFAAPASARAIPEARLLPDAAAFISAEDAAIAGLREAMPRSRRYEYGGAVLERDGRFYFTAPVTNRRRAHIAFSVVVPARHRIAAIFHTHPDHDTEGEKFSTNDVSQAKELNVVSYLGVLADRTVRVYDPLNMPTQRHREPGSLVGRGEVAAGRVVAYDVPLTLALESEPEAVPDA